MQIKKRPAHISHAMLTGDKKTLVAAGRRGGRATAEKRRQEKLAKEKEKQEALERLHALWMKGMNETLIQANRDCPPPD